MSRNLLRPDIPIITSAIVNRIGAGGVGAYNAGAGYLSLGQVSNYTTGGLFLAFDFTPFDISNSAVLVFKGAFAVGGYYLQLQSSGKLIFFCGIAGFVQTNTGIIIAGNTYRVILTGTVGTASTSWHIYVNGVDMAINTGFNVTPTTSTDDLSLMAYVKGSPFQNGIMYWFASGPNMLTNSQALSLNANPWQLFMPDDDIIKDLSQISSSIIQRRTIGQRVGTRSM